MAPLTGSLGKLDPRKLKPAARAIYAKLPDDYRAFLAAHNGGFAAPETLTFVTPIPFQAKGVSRKTTDDYVVELFGFATGRHAKTQPRDLAALAKEYAAEEFLPSGVFAIARCVQSSLVCISTNPDDRGAVYYWDWYWRYPWKKAFFDRRLARVRKKHPDVATIAKNRKHRDYQRVADAFNYATIVKLADSFDEWQGALRDATAKKLRASRPKPRSR